MVRANNIFHKLQEREKLTEADVLRTLDATDAEELAGDQNVIWELVFEGGAVGRRRGAGGCVRSDSRCWPNTPSAWPSSSMRFYHRYPILNEDRVDRKRWRAAGVAYVRSQLTKALDLMGIAMPTRM